tara:strand:+ start:741 stop:1019 length:279 start_codon:yes stop_codon:yes gene_type:complete
MRKNKDNVLDLVFSDTIMINIRRKNIVMSKKKNNRKSSYEEDYFDTDPMKTDRKNKRKSRRHRSKETLRDLTNGDEKDYQLYDDFYDNFEEF